MITDAGRKFLAVAEAIAPWLDPSQAARAVRFLMVLAGEGGEQAIAEKRRQLQGRADRELDPHGGDR